MIRRLAAIVLVGAAIALPGCDRAPRSGSTRGVVRAALYGDPRTLSLIGETDSYSQIIGLLVSDPLVEYDAKLELRPMLASSWEVSPDGRTVTFTLRDGVRWHDGRPVTARDVVFTVEKARDPATRAVSALADFQNLVRLEAPDDHTVRAEYSEPYADFLDAWTLPIIPEHAVRPGEDLLTSAFASHPVGCGPFRFVRSQPGVEIVLEANPDYWGGRPALDGITFRIVPDDRTAYQALLRGELDLMGAPPEVWEEAARSPEAARLGKYVYYRLSVWYMAGNQDGSNPFFTDARVRRALLLALDREPFIEKVLAGLARPAATTYHPDSIWAAPGIEPLPYDPAEAGRLLDEAGWQDHDGDGVRDRNGRPFSFTLLLPRSTQEITGRIAAWVQQSLAAVGIHMEIETIEWGAFLERRKAGRFEAVMAMLTFGPTPDQYPLYHSGEREGFNFFSFSDPEVDRLLEEGRRTFDLERRKAIYAELQHRLMDLQPIACLFHFASPVLYDPRLRGVEPSPIDSWRITPGPRAWHWAVD